jgi:hypothetical protein
MCECERETANGNESGHVRGGNTPEGESGNLGHDEIGAGTEAGQLDVYESVVHRCMGEHQVMESLDY